MGSMPTIGSPQVFEPLSSTPPSRAASENQAEIRRRLEEINRLMAQMEQPSNGTAQIQALQKRIEMLTKENTRLMGPRLQRTKIEEVVVKFHHFFCVTFL